MCGTVLCTYLGSSAQTQLAQQLAQQHINRYAPLQPFVPEGLLIDRSPLSVFRSTSGLDPDKFNYQQQQQNPEVADFIDYYRLFYGADYTQQTLPIDPNQIRRTYEQTAFGNTLNLPPIMRQKQFDLVLGMMHFQYREIADDALDSMYIYYDDPVDQFKMAMGNYHLYDTVFLDSNVSANYVIIDTIISLDGQRALSNWSIVRNFAMLVAMDEVVYLEPGQSMDVVLPTTLFYGNLAGLTLKIDFDDGLGYRTITPGVPQTVQYNTNGTKNILVNAIDQDNNFQFLTPIQTTIQVGFNQFGTLDAILSSQSQHCAVGMSQIQGTAYAFVKYADANNGQMRKPFVLVEGFEAEAYIPGDSVNVPGSILGFGQLNWAAISSGIFPENLAQLSYLTTFLDSLRSRGYDLVFVDFESNRATIEANALALASIIEQINTALASAGSTEHIELIGASMGGLISRVALRYMEMKKCCHNVKLFSTFSSPHLGANIPLGMQHGIKDLITRYDFAGLADEYKDQFNYILNSPVARQMLVYHVEPTAGSERFSFQNHLEWLGHPTEARKLAITNGSVDGHLQRIDHTVNSPILQAGDQLMKFSAEAWVPTAFPLPLNQKNYRNAQANGMYLILGKGYALPHSPNTVSNAQIYLGGKSVVSNLIDVTASYVTYAKAAKKVFIMAKAAKLACAANPATCFAAVAVTAVKVVVFSVAKSNQLNNMFQNNVNANNQGAHAVTASFPTLGLDNAPGDFNKNDAMFSGVIIKRNQLIARSTFVPTVSALDMDIDLFQSATAYSNYPENPFLTFEGNLTFKLSPDHYSQNTQHVFIHPYLTNQMLQNQRTSVSTSKINTQVLASALNIGIPGGIDKNLYVMNADVEMASWQVKPQAHLGVNNYMPLSFSGSQFFTQLPPDLNSHLIAKTIQYDCDTVRVHVEPNGTMEIGQRVGQNDLMTADMHFRAASTLTLFNGSVLRVNNRSTLIIEEGSTLVIYPGAQIILDGDSAVLEIKGRVVLMSQAVFSFSGSGFVRINQNQTNTSGPLWMFGAGSKISIQGSGKSDQVLEVLGEWLVSSIGGTVEILQGRVYMGSGARMNFHGPVRVNNVLVTGSASARHAGLVLHGQPTMEIKDSDFMNATRAITAYLITQQNSLRIDRSTFTENLIGLETHGKAVTLNTVIGRSNGTFWKAYDIEGVSRVRACNISSNNYGIDVMGQRGATLSIVESSIDSNSTAIFSFGDLKLNAFCSRFNNNTTAIYAGNTELLFGLNARNQFRNNHVAMYLEEVDKLDLKDGYNDFQGSDWYIVGMFSGIARNYLDTVSGIQNYFLNIRNNRMPFVNQGFPMDVLDWDGNTVHQMDWTFMSGISMANCARTISGPYEVAILSGMHTNIIVQVDGQSSPLNEALVQAILLMSESEEDENPGDLLALDRFNQLFASLRSQNILELDKDERSMLQIGLDRMMQALSNAYRFELLTAARADEAFPLSGQLSNVIDEITYRINGGHLGTWLSEVDKLRLSLAYTYRTGEYYDQALEALGALINTTAHGSDAYWNATYWQCVCDVESQLIQEEISAQEFEELRRPCMLLLPEMRKGMRTWEPLYFDPATDQEIKVTVYPNPTQEASALRQFADNGRAKVEVFNLVGNLLVTLDWVNPYDDLKLVRNNYPPGVYLVRVTFENNRIVHLKWTLQ